jgi:acyl-coenzyme A thioesterase 13
MAPQKLAVNMPGVAPGKALAGIPVGDETAEERVLALLGGSVTEDSYQVSIFIIILFCNEYDRLP